MANKFTNNIYLNGVSLYGSPTTTATDTIITNTSTEAKIGATTESYKTILTSGNGIVSFYTGSSTEDPVLKAKITNTGKFIHVDETSTTPGYTLDTNDSGVVANHNILVYDKTNNKTDVGTDSDQIPQLMVTGTSSGLNTPNGIYMTNGKYLYGIGTSSGNDVVNILDNDVNTSCLLAVNTSNNVYVNYQKATLTTDAARTSTGMLIMYGEEVRFYANDQMLLYCTSTEVNIPTGTEFRIKNYVYESVSLGFTINSTNVTSYSGSIRVIKSLNMVVCNILIAMKIAYSANTNYIIGTIASADTYSPGTLSAMNAVGYNASATAVAKATGWINNAGVIYFKQRVAGSAGHTVAITGCWFYGTPTVDEGDI